MVVTLIPTLAVYDTQTFSGHFLHKAIGHLSTLLGKSNDRAFTFVTIRHVAKVVGSDMKPFLDSIMQQVKLGLQNREKKVPEELMFQCMLVAAVGPNLTMLPHDQLDLMFVRGLSAPLHHALIEIH